MKNKNKKILVCAAWPYANGSLHLGHVAALIGSDIVARYYRQKGDDVLFVSGSDCHGTPIAVEAMKQKKDPKEISDFYHNEFVESLINGFKFTYDLYGKTSDEYHKKEVQKIFLDLHEKGFLYEKDEELPYCKTCDRFLPDRYIEGECPHCGFESARGDQCDNCGKLMDVKLLVNPKCKTCDSSPEWKTTKHFFLKLSAFQNDLIKFVDQKKANWRPNAVNFTLNYLKDGLHDRAITRDTDWGVEIPLPGFEDKRIYVWFEAVCGYLTASKKWAEESGDKDAWKPFWSGDEAVSYYVHGKDNIPFHTIIWPAILSALGGYNLPDNIVSSEYLNLENKQFSKSRKWAVWVPAILKKFDSDSVRYHLVVSGPETSDSSFLWKEFQTRHNSELIGAFGNFVHRVFSLVEKNFDGKVSGKVDVVKDPLLKNVKELYGSVGESIEKSKYRQAVKSIMKIVDQANQDINDQAPWKKLKDGDKDGAEVDLYRYLQVINNLRVLLAPFIPDACEKIGKTLGEDDISWEYKDKIKNINIQEPVPLFKRIEDEEIDVELVELKG